MKKYQIPSFWITMALLATLTTQCGTPQATVDWSNPDEWIDERLTGQAAELAHEIWERPGLTLNPRHTLGSWYLLRTYDLLADAEGTLHTTDEGRDFIDNPAGNAVQRIDREEGLLKLISIVAERGPGRRAAFIDEWSAYLLAHSNYGTESTIKDTLRRRLLNLAERGLVERAGNIYQVSELGLQHLEVVGTDDVTGAVKTAEQTEIYRLVRRHHQNVRDALLEQLEQMDPFAFERLISRLLEEMGYQNVETTAPVGDRGVDVEGDIELGITQVHEVVQVKRHQANIQRSVLDQLRGSLHRFNAIRGTIITTGGFSSGARGAAFEAGAAPITLIDGQKLLELLVEYGLGVKRTTFDVLELDPDALQAGSAEDEEE